MSPTSLPSFPYRHPMDKKGHIAWLKKKTFHLYLGGRGWMIEGSSPTKAPQRGAVPKGVGSILHKVWGSIMSWDISVRQHRWQVQMPSIDPIQGRLTGRKVCQACSFVPTARWLSCWVKLLGSDRCVGWGSLLEKLDEAFNMPVCHLLPTNISVLRLTSPKWQQQEVIHT